MDDAAHAQPYGNVSKTISSATASSVATLSSTASTSGTTALVAYTALFGAVVFEVLGAYCMKRSHNFRDVRATLGAFASIALCVVFTILALDKMTLAYAWTAYTGFEYFATIFLAIGVFGESLTAVKLTGLLLVAVGIMLLSLVEAELWPEAWDATLVHGREDEDDDGDPRHENGSLSEKEAQR